MVWDLSCLRRRKPDMVEAQEECTHFLFLVDPPLGLDGLFLKLCSAVSKCFLFGASIDVTWQAKEHLGLT